MKKVLLSISMLSVLALSSCQKEFSRDDTAAISPDKIAPDYFKFITTKKVNLDIRLLAADNKPLKGVPVQIYTLGNNSSAVFKAVTAADGTIKGSVTVPSYTDTLIVDPQYVGLLSQVKTFISGNTLTCTIGGENGFSGNVVQESISAKAGISKNNKTFSVKSGGTVYVYDSPYDESGKPLNLEAREVVSSELLQYINSSLPERQDVRAHHPRYIAETASSVLNIVQLSDVWLTYVHEGATYLNTFGYYTYKTGNPPQTPADIDTIHYVYPNSSAAGSGGGLFTGDKVKLGRFPAGTSIGFVLFSNSWDGTKVNNNVTKFYSNSDLNGESDPDLRRHTVILHNSKENLFLIGFEDKPREDPTCDHDFNDVVFYAKSNPVTGISTENIPSLDQSEDRDGDGVDNVYDEFPDDPARAYINYFPSKNSWGTLAFEDQWPDLGDYDLNDLVVNYRYAFISNAQNKVVDLNGDFYAAAAGASFENGFGVEFPFSPSLVNQVSGQRFISSYIQTASNGLEAGQSKAVIIPFDNFKAVINNANGSLFVNTDEAKPKVYGDTVRVKIEFNAPIAAETLGEAPFNPFLISNKRRGFEVHLPGSRPTDKADTRLFGASFDNTNPGNNIFYLSKENWPWAINFIEPFAYPSETKGIHQTYLHFLEWAKSGGTLYPDWYKNTGSGYRNPQNIYSK